MKKIILGITLGVLLTIGFQEGWDFYQRHYSQKHNIHILFDIVRNDFKEMLPKAKVLNTIISPDSKVKVNYKYDELYDVNVIYERDGKNREMTIQYGIFKGIWTNPNQAELESLDRSAKENKELREKTRHTIYIEKRGKGSLLTY